LDVILPIIEENGITIDEIDDRRHTVELYFEPIAEDFWGDLCWPKGHRFQGEPIRLRDDQVEVINRFLENPQSIQEIATGAGKTITTAALSYSVQNYGRSIVIVPNKSLVVQTEADYINMGLNVGVYFGDRKEFGRQHTICTWQSLNNLLKNTKSGDADITIGDFIDGVVCVMVDEVHMAKADALKTLLTGVFSHVPIRWGLTGTIPKADFEQISLLVSLGPVISKLAASDLQEKGVLAQCHVNIVQLKDGVDFKNYQSELKYLLENSDRLDKIAEVVSSIKNSGNTLILVDRVNAGHEITNRLPGSVFISGGTKLTERKEEYDEVKTSDNKIIVATYGVAAVGINIPRIFNLVLIEPGKSFVRVIQSIGRGIRKAEDKDSVEIWDITSDCKFARRHLTQRKAFYKEAKYNFSMEKLDYK
jgi:superfamily II DNA or RNA helicase